MSEIGLLTRFHHFLETERIRSGECPETMGLAPSDWDALDRRLNELALEPRDAHIRFFYFEGTLIYPDPKALPILT